MSDAAFAIAAPMIVITSPNTAAPWRVLGAHRVCWSHNLGTSGTVRVEMSFDNGATWTVVTANAPKRRVESRWRRHLDGDCDQCREYRQYNGDCRLDGERTSDHDRPHPCDVAVEPGRAARGEREDTLVWCQLDRPQHRCPG